MQMLRQAGTGRSPSSSHVGFRPIAASLVALLWLVLPAAARSQGPAQPPPSPAAAPAPHPQPDLPPDRLTSIAHSDKQVWNAVVVAPDHRVFVEFPRIAGNTEPVLATIDPQGGLVPYPGGAWNEPTAPDAKTDPGQAFIGLNAIHLGPDNSLWAVDTGVPGFGRTALPGAAKLVRIDLATDMVTRTYILPPDVLRPKSMIGDVRFNGGEAYVTDAGSPALIVLDLATGRARRLLDHDPSTTAQRPVTVDGETLKGPDNKPAMIHASRIEVTPDGKYLYYQPLPGPMYRVPTALLDDAKASSKAVSAGVEFWYDTPALSGTAISAGGTLYLNDVEHDRVLRLTPDRVLATVIHDPRLHWADAPFLHDGTLTLPVAQLDRSSVFHHGKSLIRYPIELFDLRLDEAPAAGAAR